MRIVRLPARRSFRFWPSLRFWPSHGFGPSLLFVASCALAVATLAGCDARIPPEPGGPSEVFTATDGTRFIVETVATNLEVPWSLAFAPDGRLFVTERPGRVRIVQQGSLLPEAALTLTDVFAEGEAGLLGIALHPDFAANHLVFLVYTARDARGEPSNRVVRFREVNNQLAEAVVLFDPIPGAGIHDGGRIRFGPDRLLYVTTGDAAVASLAQDPASFAGKILRLNEDGTTPRDNPFSSPVYSWGHRNPQGLDWDPVSGELWAVEHGQSANDEVNLIRRGENYGWPIIQGAQTRPDMRSPILFFEQTAAPSGASFYRGTALPGFQGNLFFGALRGTHLHRVRLDASRQGVADHERLLDGPFGRLRDVVTGPDGALYFTTSNRDGRGTPAADDDKILRIVAAR